MQSKKPTEDMITYNRKVEKHYKEKMQSEWKTTPIRKKISEDIARVLRSERINGERVTWSRTQTEGCKLQFGIYKEKKGTL